MSVEFRVQGKNSEVVAEELADLVKAKWGVQPTIQKAAPSAKNDDTAQAVRGEVKGLVEGALLAIHVLVVAHTVYEALVREPHEKAVAKWRELVFFAKEKRPTLVRILIGDQSVLLHEGDPERMHELTRKALDSAIVTKE